MKKCMYCGIEIADEAKFCHSCGKQQAVMYTQVFDRQSLKEKEFIQKINEWFEANPQIAVAQCQFTCASKLGLLVNKYVLNRFAIRYICVEGNNPHRYAVTQLQSTGITKKKNEVLLDRWKAENPGAIVLKTEGGVHQRGKLENLVIANGFGAVNKTQLYVFFKYHHQYGTAGDTPKSYPEAQ